ncbi:MAG: hypothetical protein ABI675_21635 [Chitinophagaceae bacterium]
MKEVAAVKTKPIRSFDELKDTKFISNNFIIYKKGVDVSGYHYDYWRAVRIQKTREGITGYNVSIYKLGKKFISPGNRKLVSIRNMKLVDQSDTQIILCNFGADNERSSISNYRLVLQLHNKCIEKITWKGYNIDTDIVFFKAPPKEIEKAVNIPFYTHLSSLQAPEMQEGKNRLIEKFMAINQEMKVNGHAIQSTANYYLYLGQLLYSQQAYREAKEAFTQSNMLLQFNGFPANHEAIYWFAKIEEANGDMIAAKKFYLLSLDRFSDNRALISRQQIEAALNKL